MYSLQVSDLTIKIKNREILSSITFSMLRGQSLAVVGPNGAGKSTLVKAVIGIYAPSAGRIVISTRNHIAGYCPQDLPEDRFFMATAYEIIYNAACLSRIYEKQDRIAIINEIIELLQIKEFAFKRYSSLSGGQKRRVLLARALMVSREFLVLDEPTTALDPGAVASFYEILSNIKKSFGTSVLMVSHDLPRVLDHVDEILCIDRKIMFKGSVEDFSKSSSARYLTEFKV